VRREDYRATLVLAVGLLAATVTGFLREATLAYELGVGRETDIYVIAFAIPEFIYIALPIILLPAFIPLFTDVRQKAGEAGAWRFARQTAIALLALLLGATILIWLGAQVFLQWLAPGFDPLQLAQAERALYLMLPAICFLGAATLATALLQAYRRFGPPALARSAFNLAFVAALLGLPLAWSVGRAAWGVTLGAVAAFVIQVPVVWRQRPPASASKETKTGPPPASVADLARVAGPLAAAYAVHHAVLFVDRAMATTLSAGSAATIAYGYRLALVVGQISGLAVSTALFPRISEQASVGDDQGLRTSLAGALRFVWMVGLPASCGLVLLREPIVEGLFQRGAFDSAATAAVSEVLVWYALAVLADALCQPFWRVLYAWRSSWTVLAVNSLQTAVRVLLNVALIGELGYNGLALSAALGLTLQATLLSLLVRRRLGAYLTRKWWRDAAKVVLATVVALVVAGVTVNQLTAWPALATVAASGAVGSLAYLSILWLLEKGIP
jgi:putative peptidoglycan lipid II flippase